MSNVSDSAVTASSTHSNSSSKSVVSFGNGKTAPVAASSMHGSNSIYNFTIPANSLGNAANAADYFTQATASKIGKLFQDSETRTTGARSIFNASENRLNNDENEG